MRRCRVIKKELRKKANRSGSELCPICKEPSILVEHHIRGKNIANPNAEYNLAHICDKCHRLTHEGEVVLEGWFMTTEGRELFWHYKNEPSYSGESITPYIIPK